MLALLLSGDGQVAAASTTRAQLPLLLSQLVVSTIYAVDQAVETDLAQDMAVFRGATIVQVNQAEEADTAQNVTVYSPGGAVSLPIDQAVETDTAQNMVALVRPGGTFPSTTTYPGSTTYPWSGMFFAVDQALETDEAFAIAQFFRFMSPALNPTSPLITPHSDLTVEITPVVPV